MALSRRTGNRFQNSIWPGFVDAMTGLLLVLMFVLTIFMIVQFVLRETISGQASKLDALSAEVAALADALGLEQDKNATLTERVGELTVTLGDARAREEQQASLIATLQAERAEQDQALAEAATRIASFEEQVAGLLSQQETNLGTIAALEGERDTLLTEQEQLNLALANLRDEIDQQAEVARLAAARREALESLIADLRRRYAEEQDRTTQLSGQVASLETQLTEEEQLRLAEAAAAEALRERLENADTELTAMTLALEEQRQRAEETLTLLAATQSEQEDLDIQLAAALLTQDTLQDDLAAALLIAEEKDQRIATLEAQIADATEIGEATATRLSSLEAQLAAALADAEGRGAELESLRLELSQTEGARAALEEQNTTLEARVAAAEQELAAVLDQRDSLDGQSAGLETRIALLETQLTALQDERTTLAGEAKSLEERLAEALAAKIAAENASVENAELIAELQSALSLREDALAKAQLELAELKVATETAQALSQDADDVREQLAAALAARLAAENAAAAEARETEDIREELANALAAKLAAEQEAQTQLSEAERQAILLSEARSRLAEEQEISAEAQRQQALLSQQVAALRDQLGQLQALLDDAKAREAAADVQIQALGQDLNLALARAAAEERRRRILEEEERKRLEAEAEDLQRYRSEFFGQLRDVLGAQEGVRIVGDRFVFSSEVLFEPAQAELALEGQEEIAKVVDILQSVVSSIPSEIDWVLQVDGHTDNVPIRNSPIFANNWELSQARALSVVLYMVNNLGVSPDRLSANGFGEFQPVALGDSPEARAQNRRIELKFTEK